MVTRVSVLCWGLGLSFGAVAAEPNRIAAKMLRYHQLMADGDRGVHVACQVAWPDEEGEVMVKSGFASFIAQRRQGSRVLVGAGLEEPEAKALMLRWSAEEGDTLASCEVTTMRAATVNIEATGVDGEPVAVGYSGCGVHELWPSENPKITVWASEVGCDLHLYTEQWAHEVRRLTLKADEELTLSVQMPEGRAEEPSLTVPESPAPADLVRADRRERLDEMKAQVPRYKKLYQALRDEQGEVPDELFKMHKELTRRAELMLKWTKKTVSWLEDYFEENP